MFDTKIDGKSGDAAESNGAPRKSPFLEWLVAPSTLRRAAAYAIDDAPILIEGETGTGKSELARWIHRRSRHADGPVVRWGCGEFDEGTARSVLFGYVAGAFTDAKMERPGIFETAHGGTVILDDIDYLSTSLQSALLGVIDSGVVKRIGDTHRERPARARLIVTTNKDIEAACANRSFLPDLAYRLSFLTLRMAPLHERPDALRRLVIAVAASVEAPDGGTMAIAANALDTITARQLAGNIRELMALVRRAGLMARFDGRSEILKTDIDDTPGLADAQGNASPRGRGYSPAEALDALRRHNWRIAAAARELGCARQTLYDLINRHGWR